MGFSFKIQNDFMKSEDCQYIVNHFSDKLTTSGVIGDSSLRTSDDFYVDFDSLNDPISLKIFNDLKIKISELSNLPIENQELLTIIRYREGQEFKPHLDAFNNYDDFEIESILGGQRLSTVIVCLKEAESGGETTFYKINESIKLKESQCLYWENVDKDGIVLEDSMHGGEAPLSGEKWIITCWIRENKYYPINREVVKKIIQEFPKEVLINALKSL